jgi:hypothetical protein
LSLAHSFFPLSHYAHTHTQHQRRSSSNSRSTPAVSVVVVVVVAAVVAAAIVAILAVASPRVFFSIGGRVLPLSLAFCLFVTNLFLRRQNLM